MRIAIAGANGFLGRNVARALGAEGHEIVSIVRHRRPEMTSVVEWDPAAARIDAGGLEGLDAVINLVGENVAGWWTAAKKRRIRDSRVRSTTFLSERLGKLKRPPPVLVSGSAVDYYGHHGSNVEVDETSPPGTSFLSSLAREWEAATSPAEAAGIRVVHARLGLVLGRGGAIGVMLPLFQIGLGGAIGSGDQIVSWIALAELAPAMMHVIQTPGLAGAVNFTAPGAVSFREFAQALAAALNRPALFRLPSFAARLALGQLADEMLLSGRKVVPRKLLESGYRFREPEVHAAMKRAIADGQPV